MTSWFANPDSGVSAHYGIAKNGRIAQYVQDEHCAHGARGTLQMLPPWMRALPNPISTGYTLSRPNAYCLHIELELLKEDPDGAYSDDQYSATNDLVAMLIARHHIPRNRRRVLSHAELQSDRRDPRGINWARIGL